MTEWNKDEYLQKRKALERAGNDCKGTAESKDLIPSEVVAWIYGILTMLDTKASALMRLNGVLIAAATFLLAQFASPHSLMLGGRVQAVLVVVAALLSAISITLCLFVVNVGWPFLGKAEISGATVKFSEEICALSKTMNRRQLCYRSAWWVSLVASGCFFFELFMQTYHIICGAWGV
ncbi:hypothetical protein SAMN05518854_117133 [Variovorax sp. YR266]|uniref:hypothetical protein n=1 Tax=Variovorax sp. YR266 TaxID=1884386 RepID=UPI000896B4A3|nr:hypothetical protein [Variovorax sp. YR266]SDZ71401.1 hypothetical protein SAMN05518854_117133 [Variovorax sp. YR266]